MGGRSYDHDAARVHLFGGPKRMRRAKERIERVQLLTASARERAMELAREYEATIRQMPLSGPVPQAAGLRPRMRPTHLSRPKFRRNRYVARKRCQAPFSSMPLSRPVSVQTGSSTRRRPRPQQGCRRKDRSQF
jgi:hypothetical protein